jgi:predicted GIY-YIG superfamily endonuclease
MQRNYCVYILKSLNDRKTYTGFTTDLKNRIKQHNENIGGYTKNRGPWEIIWYGVFRERHLAECFERYLKSGSGIAFARKRLIRASSPSEAS